ncbi:MAG TPA: hypothetical protein ENI85_15835 [Deltaproteobacteria bacterium]|nr:hypothetical protein [Deltaproteobacteria bacterium]
MKTLASGVAARFFLGVGFLLAGPFMQAEPALADAGVACSGTICGLGGQIRGQTGFGHPAPLSTAPAQTGAFDGITIRTAAATPNGLAPVGEGLGQPGQIKPTPAATIMQTSGPEPRALTLPVGVFRYDRASRSLPAIGIQGVAVVTNLDFAFPHPGTNATGMVVMGPLGSALGSVMLSAGGRPGAPIVSFYAGASANGTPGTNYGATLMITPMAGNPAGVNGVARFVRTANQFGGVGLGRILGTAKQYFPISTGFTAPCTGCVVRESIVPPPTVPVAGGPFGGVASRPGVLNPTALYTATIGANGTLVHLGNPVTSMGSPLAFTGQDVLSVGFPLTTGRLSITVTSVAVGASTEMFRRTGIDARDANGNGVVALVSGSISTRNVTRGNANRSWITLEIPEPGALASAAAGGFALLAAHRVVRRRQKRMTP